MNSLFCRHNRFTADCPICSKGTVLDPVRQQTRAAAAPRQKGPRSRSASHRAKETTGVRRVTGPYASAGPYERDGGAPTEVRLERVPGGIRLAEWVGGTLEPRAPVLDPADLALLVAGAREREVLAERDIDVLERALAASADGPLPAREEPFGASAGSAGLMRDELRVERLDDGRLRVARWIFRPSHGWERQEAPVMLPAKRYAEAIADAVRRGLL